MSAYACSIVAVRDEDGAPLLPSRVPIGGIVQLKRERGSATRPEAIAAYHDRRKVGYLPQEKRWIWEALNDSRHTVIVVGQVATTSGEIIAFDVEITVTERRLARIPRNAVTRQRRLMRLMPAFAALALTFATLVALERVAMKGDAISPDAPSRALVESDQAAVPPASSGNPTFGTVATVPLVAALEARRAARDSHIEPDVISGSLQSESAFQDMRVGRRAIGRLVEDGPGDDAAAKPSQPRVANPLPRPLSKPTKTAARSLEIAARTEAAPGPAVESPIRPSFPAIAFAHGAASLVTSMPEPPAASEPVPVTARPPPDANEVAAPASPPAASVITVKPRVKPIHKTARPIEAKPKPAVKQKKKRKPPPLAPGLPSGNAAEAPDW